MKEKERVERIYRNLFKASHSLSVAAIALHNKEREEDRDKAKELRKQVDELLEPYSIERAVLEGKEEEVEME
jgi:hypothetical protein